MYVGTDFKSKKDLKEAVKNGEDVRLIKYGPFDNPNASGTVFLEGPHYPKPHTWYAQCEAVDGKIVSVK